MRIAPLSSNDDRMLSRRKRPGDGCNHPGASRELAKEFDMVHATHIIDPDAITASVVARFFENIAVTPEAKCFE